MCKLSQGLQSSSYRLALGLSTTGFASGARVQLDTKSSTRFLVFQSLDKTWLFRNSLLGRMSMELFGHFFILKLKVLISLFRRLQMYLPLPGSLLSSVCIGKCDNKRRGSGYDLQYWRAVACLEVEEATQPDISLLF